MRNTTFRWLRPRDDSRFALVTPIEVVLTCRDPGDAGSKARGEIALLYGDDIFEYGRALTHSKDEAYEMRQEFAAQFLKAEIYTRYDQKLGGFRAFLKGWARMWVASRRQDARRLHEAPLASLPADAPARGKSPEEAVDILFTATRVSEARKRTEYALELMPFAWAVFDLWHFQRDEARPFTQAELAQELGITEGEVIRLLEHGRSRFLRDIISVIATSITDDEQLPEELGVTREVLETILARRWREPLPWREVARRARVEHLARHKASAGVRQR